ncbi:MAG: aldo/keto reductase [Gemmatimonadetes bacterium]|nr:aldo/keto reductase [Gemmatimonadota bacterium]
MPAVERRTLGPGLGISRVVTGLWQVADMERDGRTLDLDAAALAMAPYAGAGLTTFDMADHYGSAEEIAGRFRASRDPGDPAVQLLTKWVPEPGAVTAGAARGAVTRALTRLRAERVDLMQFHAWRFSDASWLDALGQLADLRAEGLVGELGVTNFDTAHLRVALASGIPLVSNQVSCSLLDRRAQGRMAALCGEFGVQLLAYGTLAGGLIGERWVGAPEPRQLATWSQMKYKRFVDAAGGWAAFQQLLEAVRQVARRLGTSMASVATRYVLDQPAVAGVIVGARLGLSEHIAGNVAVFGLRLDDEARDALGAAVAALAPIPGDCGDEYRVPPFLTASGDLSHHLADVPPPFPVRDAGDGVRRAFSGTSWESMAGYCRAVRTGDRILVSGTTATNGSRVVGGADPAAQAHFAIDKIAGAIESLGGRLADVVRTRVFVQRIADWEAVARVHGERFATIQPANTLVQATLVGEEYLVEIEAEAVVRG